MPGKYQVHKQVADDLAAPLQERAGRGGPGDSHACKVFGHQQGEEGMPCLGDGQPADVQVGEDDGASTTGSDCQTISGHA